ncbi:hypothetical protein AMTR_s00062p00205800 [Amborella trichopoda]|uniref:Uncharacterized protein n=1 Tax=Amborella trichopoda TaxID=13333 RepID=U5D274_AMBTC|nr:hypothetical protein AMTR_s00062p00205800 [Amborella trichopoda]
MSSSVEGIISHGERSGMSSGGGTDSYSDPTPLPHLSPVGITRGAFTLWELRNLLAKYLILATLAESYARKYEMFRTTKKMIDKLEKTYAPLLSPERKLGVPICILTIPSKPPYSSALFRIHGIFGASLITQDPTPTLEELLTHLKAEDEWRTACSKNGLKELVHL